MEIGSSDTVQPKPQVKTTLRLGSEVYSIGTDKGTLSEQLAAMKENCMSILKEFIAKHNAPNDVPDEPIEGASEDEEGTFDNPPKKSKK